MENITHTHGLFGGGVVVVQLAPKQAQPFPQVEDPVIHEVTRTTLDYEDTLVGQVLGQSAADNTASGATSDNDIVVAVDIANREVVSGSHNGRV